MNAVDFLYGLLMPSLYYRYDVVVSRVWEMDSFVVTLTIDEIL